MMAINENRISIMLVDDHAVVRAGLKRFLEQEAKYIVLVEAESAERAYQLFSEYLPDITVMDLNMPGMGGMEGIKRITSRYPSAKIVVLSMNEDAVFATQSIKAGAKGYVTKAGLAEDLIEAIEQVASGNTYFSAEIANKIALQVSSPSVDVMSDLSGREFEILRMLLEGLDLPNIARSLNISLKTAANYQTSIKRKLGVDSPVEMVRLAMKHGVI